MSSDRLYDVIVVGAGPAGSACATVLARNGLDVLLIDRARFPREKICGDCLNPRSWSTLDEIGAADAVKAAPHRRISGVRIASWQGRSVQSSLPQKVREPFVAIRRRVLDQALLDNALNSGVTILQETQVFGVETGQTLRVRAKQSTGLSSFTCRYLVGADGRNSIVARGVPEGPGKTRHHSRVGLQWFAPFQPRLGYDVLLVLLPYGYVGVVNVDDHNANIAVSADARHIPEDLRALPACLMKTIASNVEIRDLISDLLPVSEILTASPVRPRVNISQHPRILLAGDARQTVEPFTGEGVTFALRDGVEKASSILVSEGGLSHPRGRPRTVFWVNRIYAPLLRRPNLLNAVLGHRSASPRLLAAAMRTVFR